MDTLIAADLVRKDGAARRTWPGIALIAAAAFGAELAVSGRYGYVRDELYFLTAGHHLAFGYVDQPPLTPVLARLAELAGGGTLVGFRVLPALVLAAVVMLTAGMSRALGAGRTGQLLAALAVATCGEYLGICHELTTSTPDLLFWTITLYLGVRLLTSRDPRWWLAIGACAGISAEAKWNIAFLLASMAAGFGFGLNREARGLLHSRYLLAGVVIAAALATPDLSWQAMHGWPNLAVFGALQGSAGQNRLLYWPAQLGFTGPVLAPVWISGVVWSLRNQAARAFRPLGIACVAVLVLQFALGGKAYYPGGAYTFLLAAGTVPVERWLAERRAPRRAVGWLTAAVLAGGLVAAPISLSALPARALHTVPLQKINYDLAETIGWPQQVALVAREYDALPAAERAHTTILTGNYGEAGAVSRYGAGFGLPGAYSGANNFWLWGPPPAADTSAIAVNVDPARLHREFAHVQQVATFTNGLGVDDDEQGVLVYLATGLKTSWTQAWPAFRDYS